MKYRKKPIVIEAVQFVGGRDSASQIIRWANVYGAIATWHYNHGTLTIMTLEGSMTVKKGDWVIKGVKTEFYPCKPDIFEATYEPVEEENEG